MQEHNIIETFVAALKASDLETAIFPVSEAAVFAGARAGNGAMEKAS